MIYLKKGKLPWLRQMNYNNLNKRKVYDLITKRKLDSKLEDITSDLPEELQKFYLYCREGIDFYERPDYALLKGLLHSIIHKEQFSNVLCYQWQFKQSTDLTYLQGKVTEYK